MSKPIGATAIKPKLRQLITADDYARVVKTLLDMVFDEKEWSKNRIMAAKVIIEYCEGRAPIVSIEEGVGPKVAGITITYANQKESDDNGTNEG